MTDHTDRNSGKVWSETEVEELRDYARDGATVEEIAEYLMRSQEEILTGGDTVTMTMGLGYPDRHGHFPVALILLVGIQIAAKTFHLFLCSEDFHLFLYWTVKGYISLDAR